MEPLQHRRRASGFRSDVDDLTGVSMPVCDLHDVLLDNHRGMLHTRRRSAEASRSGWLLRLRLVGWSQGPVLTLRGVGGFRKVPSALCSPQLTQPIVNQDMTVVPANGWLEFKANLVESSPRV